MSNLRLSPRHVAAFANHREALELCRRFGNIARFRARALRSKLKPLGLSRCGDRYPHLGAGEFEGFVLTPPIYSGDATGMGPEFAGLIVFGGVALRDGLEHRADLVDADVPELQVGVLLRPLETVWPQLSRLLEGTLAGLMAEGFEVHSLAARETPTSFLEWLMQEDDDAELDPPADEADEADAGEEAFDQIDEEAAEAGELTETETWVDLEDEGAPVETDADDPEGAPHSLLLLRRLPLDRLPVRCGAIVTRFFASALAPLLAMSDPEWQALILARDTRGELGEEE